MEQSTKKISIDLVLKDQTYEDFKDTSEEEILREFMTYYFSKKQRNDFYLELQQGK